MISESNALFVQARAGDPSALGTLLEAYRGYLTLLARVQLGRRLQTKVEPADVVQDAVLDAVRQFDRFRGESEAELLGWLRQILAGQIADTLRRYLGTKGRDVAMERELVMQLDQSSQVIDRGLTAPTSSPSQHAARREQAVILAEALDRLPADYREVIILRHIEQHPFSEVARQMNRTEDSVQKLWVRALSSLRHSLGSDA